MATLKEDTESLESTILELKETLAEKQGLLEENKAQLAKTTQVKENIEAYLESIAADCDFLEEHLEERNMARESEKEALEKAKKLLKDTPVYKASLATDAGAPAAAL